MKNLMIPQNIVHQLLHYWKDIFVLFAYMKIVVLIKKCKIFSIFLWVLFFFELKLYSILSLCQIEDILLIFYLLIHLSYTTIVGYSLSLSSSIVYYHQLFITIINCYQSNTIKSYLCCSIMLLYIVMFHFFMSLHIMFCCMMFYYIYYPSISSKILILCWFTNHLVYSSILDYFKD